MSRHLWRNSIINIVGQSLPLGLGLLLIPPTMEALGKERFGILMLTWTMLFYFFVLDLGISRAVVKFIAEARARQEAERYAPVIWSGLSVQVGFGLFLTICSSFLLSYLVNDVLKVQAQFREEASLTFRYLSFCIPFSMVAALLKGVLEGFQDFFRLNLIRIPFNSSLFVIPWAVSASGHGLDTIMIGILAACIVYCLAFLYYVKRNVPDFFSNRSITLAQSKKLLNFGGWVAVSTFVSPVLENVERFILGSLSSLSAITFYATPVEMVTRLRTIPIGLATAIFPMFSALGEAGSVGEREAVFARGVKFISIFFTPLVLVLIVFAKQLLSLWLGPEFAGKSAIVLQLVGCGIIFNAYATIAFTLLQAKGLPRPPAILHLMQLIPHVIISFLMIKWLSIDGAAAAWALRAVLDCILLYLLCFRHQILTVSFTSLERLREIFILLTVFLFTIIGVSIFVTGPITLGFLVFFGYAVLLIAIVFIGLPYDERRTLLQYVRIR